MDFDCTICNDRITNPENISVAKLCGHIFHYKCLTTFVKPRYVDCPVCSKKIVLANVLQIHPTLVDRQEDDQRDQDSRQGISDDNSDEAGCQQSPLSTHNYEKQIAELQNRLEAKECEVIKLKFQKEQYHQKNQKLKKARESALDEANNTIDSYSKLQEKYTQNNEDLLKLTVSNTILQEELQTLKIKLENNEKHLDSVSLNKNFIEENLKLAKQNEHLTNENEKLKEVLITLKKEMAVYDMAVTNLMMKQLRQTLSHKTDNKQNKTESVTTEVDNTCSSSKKIKKALYSLQD